MVDFVNILYSQGDEEKHTDTHTKINFGAFFLDKLILQKFNFEIANVFGVGSEEMQQSRLLSFNSLLLLHDQKLNVPRPEVI